MKIAICGSMSASKEMVAIGKELAEYGHLVLLPKHTEEYANNLRAPETHEESSKNKLEGDLIRGYFNEIKKTNAVLVVNINKDEKLNYIGGNTFLEMAFAHVLDKKIFVLNKIYDYLSYYDEIIAMSPVVLNGNLSIIEQH